MKISLSFLVLLSQIFLYSYALTKCRTSGKWVVVAVPKSQLLPLLAEGIYFDYHPYNISSDLHPVFLEFNYQHDCWTFLVLPSPNFHEFKIQIPYTMTENINSAIYKPLVLSDNWISSLGSKYAFGLPSYTVEFSGDNVNNFSMHNKEESIYITANFSYFGKKLTNYNKTINFLSYQNINEQLWFTDELNFNSKEAYCASNRYNWEGNTSFRYMSASIDISWGKKFEGKYKVPRLDSNFLGGLEVDADLYISFRSICPKSQKI